MAILFVYATYVYWQIVAHQIVKLGLETTLVNHNNRKVTNYVKLEANDLERTNLIDKGAHHVMV